MTNIPTWRERLPGLWNHDDAQERAMREENADLRAEVERVNAERFRELQGVRAALFSAEADNNRLYKVLANVANESEARQAKIDALMLEFCPDRMTPEHIPNWKKHQKKETK